MQVSFNFGRISKAFMLFRLGCDSFQGFGV